MASSTLVFLMTKFVVSEVIEIKLKKNYPIFKTVNEILKTYGLKIAFIFRLCPLIPPSISAVLFGLFSKSERKHFFISGIAYVPSILFEAYLGTMYMTSEKAKGEMPWSYCFYLGFEVLTGLISISLVIGVFLFARATLRKQIIEQ